MYLSYGQILRNVLRIAARITSPRDHSIRTVAGPGIVKVIAARTWLSDRFSWCDVHQWHTVVKHYPVNQTRVSHASPFVLLRLREARGCGEEVAGCSRTARERGERGNLRAHPFTDADTSRRQYKLTFICDISRAKATREARRDSPFDSRDRSESSNKRPRTIKSRGRLTPRRAGRKEMQFSKWVLLGEMLLRPPLQYMLSYNDYDLRSPTRFHLNPKLW